MAQSSEQSAHIPCIQHREEYDLCTRVQAEFREMPGLKLTLPQASRLFSIEPKRCERVLTALVHAGYLASDGKAFASHVTHAAARDSLRRRRVA
jgi:hypothetical protein